MLATRRSLEGGTTFHWVYMQRFRPVWLTVKNELKINVYPVNDPDAIFVWFVPSTRKILALGTIASKTFSM